MTAPATTHGTITNVSQTKLGDELIAAAAVGSTLLLVDDVADFDESGGSLRIGGDGGEVLTYTAISDDASSIVLASPTTVAHSIGDRVDLWDVSLQAATVEWRALVAPVSDLDASDVIDAVISHALVPLLPEGIRDAGAGESVVLTQQHSTWVVTDVRGRTPQLDGSLVRTGSIPQGALSFTTKSGTTATISTDAPDPSSATRGDLWFDQSNGYRMAQFDGTQWAPKQWGSAAIDPNALGVKTYLGTTPPDAPNDGDLWLAVDSFGGMQMQRWDATSSAWVPLVWNTDAIAANAITAGKLQAGSIDALSVSSLSISGGTMQGHVISSSISGSDFLIDNDNGRVLVYAQAATVQTLPGTPGNQLTYTVPAGVTSLKVECWAGGGGGGGGATQTGTHAANVWGGGGGGGEYARENALTVTPGQIIQYDIGPGGFGGNAGGSGTTSASNGGNGNVGGQTWFGPLSAPLVVAKGGKGGQGAQIGTLPVNGAGGAGGTGSTNGVHFDGGAGDVYGGGGSSAGPSSKGNTATSANSLGASAVTGGGKGGDGAIAGLQAVGTNGSAPGGGGGGGNTNSAGYSQGSQGGAGKIVVTYYVTTLVASIAQTPGTDTLSGTAYPAGMKVQRADLVETPAPIGSLLMFAGATAPAGYLLCDGRSLLRAGTYAPLFSVIGTAYGVGTDTTGGTTFALPDLRVRLPLGAGSRPAGAAGAATTVAVGATGGNDAHTHSTPNHSHPLGTAGAARIMASGTAVIVDTGNNTLGVTPNFSATATGFARTSGGTATAASAALQGATEQGGSSTTGIPTNGYPPYAAVNYLIKF